MTTRKILALLTAVVLSVGMFCGCGDNGDKNSSAQGGEVSSQGEQVAEESSEVEKIPETDEEWNQAMLNKAMVSYGNTYQMQEVIKKAQAGEQVTIAYLGGSITEGISAGAEGCYAKLTYDYFAEKFGTGENVGYCNAGISGTPSKLGVLRLDRDVLSSDPDVVFIEFAVNDGNDADHQNAYESIVQTLMKKDIAVVLLFSVTAEDYSAQDYMKNIGEAYDLPMISYCDALRYLFENNRLTWEEFSDDQSHPNEYGHKLVASMIDYYFDTVMDVESKGEPMMPMENVYSPREVDAHMVENDGITPIELGSWKEGTTTARFEKGWFHSKSSGNDPIVFEMDAKFLYMIYREIKSGNYGKLHVHVTANGEEYDDVDYEVVAPNGWGNPQVRNIAMMPETTTYRVEISMAEGDEETLGELLGFGFTS